MKVSDRKDWVAAIRRAIREGRYDSREEGKIRVVVSRLRTVIGRGGRRRA